MEGYNMNKIYEFVATQLIACERRAIIADYDKWASTGVIGDSLLRTQARNLAVYLYGDNAKYGPPITTNMKELYIAVCRYIADQYYLV